MKDIIACIYNVKNLDYSKPILDGFDKIQFRKLIKSNDSILIKPNFTWPYYRYGVTTSPILLDQLTRILKNRCDKIYIGESDGGNFSWSATQCFKGHNLFEIAKKNGIDLINLSNETYTFKRIKVKNEIIKLKVSKFILEKIDSIITIPVLKTHVATRVSLGLKNQWGCLPDPMRLLYHPFLNKAIVAVNKIYSPKISIIDATYGLTGSGPIFGIPIKMNKIFISNNVTALDIIATKFMGIDYTKIKHIYLAKNEFLKNFNLKNILKHGNFENEFKFKIQKRFFDKMAVFIMFHNQLNKIFYDSFISGVIQKYMDFYKFLFKKKSAY